MTGGTARGTLDLVHGDLTREIIGAFYQVYRELTPQLRQRIHDAGLDDDVVVVPRLPDSDMPLLYSAATALVFASVFEGGGLPVMEALACGCPVVASSIPTTREFAGAAALMFDPLDEQSITAAMKEFESSPDVRQRLSAAAAHTTPTSAHEMASAMLGAYRAAVHPKT